MSKIGAERRKVYNKALIDIYHRNTYDNTFEDADKERYQRYWLQIYNRFKWCEFWYYEKEYHIEDFIHLS
jgi:predicted O-methyltransferase YrrM